MARILAVEDDALVRRCIRRILTRKGHEVIEAAHIVPVSDNGSDDSGNGLLLCRNHHALFDMGKWCLDPTSLEVISATGHDLQSLGVTRSNATHLQLAPSKEALEWRWEHFSSD